MKEKIVAKIGNSLDELNLFIDYVNYEKEDNTNYLRICLDSNDIIEDLFLSCSSIFICMYLLNSENSFSAILKDHPRTSLM